MARQVLLVGVGKIARDQHVPAMAASDDWDLVATVSRANGVDGVPSYPSIAEALAAHPGIEMVTLCMPPMPRYDYALEALNAGRHVMMEKPPCGTVSEALSLEKLAAAKGLTLFATWHSRHGAQVEKAKTWLADRVVTDLDVQWKEDVRRWHPGQDWVFEAGGMGVFDPGINALSILTHILPQPLLLKAAVLDFPENRQTPIGATLDFAAQPGHALRAEFDWRQEGPQTWRITVRCGEHELILDQGGADLILDGVAVARGPDAEYPALYARMAQLIDAGASDVDLSPMILVSDALTLGTRNQVDAFHF